MPSQPTDVAAGGERVPLALGAMVPLMRCGLREMLRPYDVRVRLRADGAPALASDLWLVDPYAAAVRSGTGRPAVPSDAQQVVVYTWYPLDDPSELEGLARAWECRLRGWLTVTTLPEELVTELERINRGETVVEQREMPADRATIPDAHLSHREAQVLWLIAAGLDNRQIVARTFLSKNTIKSYIRSAYRKIGARSRSEAVLWGVAHGMTGPRGLRYP